MSDLFDLTGRVALITGGSRGLGLQIATAFAQSGATVVVSSRKQDACDAAAATFDATSARKLELSWAASSFVSGGMSRVFTVPATDALAMIATAHNCSDMTVPRVGHDAPLGSRCTFLEPARIIIRDLERNTEFRSRNRASLEIAAAQHRLQACIGLAAARIMGAAKMPRRQPQPRKSQRG